MKPYIKHLTNQQKQYIVSLRLYECCVGEGGRHLSVTKKFWADLGNRLWQTANTRQLTELRDKGYLQSVTGGNNTTFYSLTRAARRAADGWIQEASYHQWQVEQPSLPMYHVEDEDGGLG